MRHLKIPTACAAAIPENERMPVIYMFYGIIVSLYFLDNRRHKLPHVHAKYQQYEVVVYLQRQGP